MYLLAEGKVGRQGAEARQGGLNRLCTVNKKGLTTAGGDWLGSVWRCRQVHKEKIHSNANKRLEQYININK